MKKITVILISLLLGILFGLISKQFGIALHFSYLFLAFIISCVYKRICPNPSYLFAFISYTLSLIACILFMNVEIKMMLELNLGSILTLCFHQILLFGFYFSTFFMVLGYIVLYRNLKK